MQLFCTLQRLRDNDAKLPIIYFYLILVLCKCAKMKTVMQYRYAQTNAGWMPGAVRN